MFRSNVRVTALRAAFVPASPARPQRARMRRLDIPRGQSLPGAVACALVVTSATRSELVPELSTLIEQGLPGFQTAKLAAIIRQNNISVK